MAASFTCDGCGVSVEVPMVVGHVLKRDYCAECEKKAQAFIEAEDKERESIRTVFLGKREKLIKKFGADNFKLPDVP